MNAFKSPPLVVAVQSSLVISKRLRLETGLKSLGNNKQSIAQELLFERWSHFWDSIYTLKILPAL